MGQEKGYLQVRFLEDSTLQLHFHLWPLALITLEFQGPIHYLAHQPRKRSKIQVLSVFPDKYKIDFSKAYI